MRKANFNNLLKILRRQKPDRPTLFDFFLNPDYYKKLAGREAATMNDELAWYRLCAYAYYHAGYDYVTMNGSAYPAVDASGELRWSDNQMPYKGIANKDDLDGYAWPDPAQYDYSMLDKMGALLPEGMKIVAHQYDGIWEMAQKRLAGGYAGAGILMIDDPELCRIVFDEIGSRYLTYYQIVSRNEHVGALLCNDDWGFKTQTMIRPDYLRMYVFPWYKKIVQACHDNDKPVILHSCGRLDSVMDDIFDMGFDGKQSFEDQIVPVEEFYERYHDKIAVLGGMDMDFMCRAGPGEIRRRCDAMLERAGRYGGYALGTGNSVPEYVPWENYLAMLETANPEVRRTVREKW